VQISLKTYSAAPPALCQIPTYTNTNVTTVGCTSLPSGFVYSTSCPVLLSYGGGGSGKMAGSSNLLVDLKGKLETYNSANHRNSGDTTYYRNQAQYAIDQTITKLLNDTVTPGRDTLLISALKMDPSDRGKANLAYIYLRKNDFTNAQAYIDSVKTIQGYSKRGDLLQAIKDAKSQNRNLQTLSSNSSVLNFAFDSLSKGFGNARSLLCLSKSGQNYQYIESLPPSGDISKSSNPLQDQSTGFSSINDENLKLKAYPNPFKEELRVRISISNLDPSAKLSLIEPASGRIIFEKNITSNEQEIIIPTSELSSGLYMVGVRGGSFPAKFIKVSNVH
jgi:hypothetical protein